MSKASEARGIWGISESVMGVWRVTRPRWPGLFIGYVGRGESVRGKSFSSTWEGSDSGLVAGSSQGLPRFLLLVLKA